MTERRKETDVKAWRIIFENMTQLATICEDWTQKCAEAQTPMQKKVFRKRALQALEEMERLFQAYIREIEREVKK